LEQRAVPQPEGAETHLRNIFHKTNVSSRVGLARAIEHADRTTGTPGRQ
jgi:hypothetical protein